MVAESGRFVKKLHVRKGDRFHRLTILVELPTVGNGQRRAFVQCDCGNTKSVGLYDVFNGKIESCGCYRNQRVRETVGTHGVSHTVEYRTWWDMIKRCSDPSHPSYHRYGGRGILVCDEWLNSVDTFIKDIGTRPDNCECIDRIDNNLGYFLGNVRWTTKSTNSKNTIASRYWIIDDVVYESISDAAIALGISTATVRQWCNGWKCYRYGKKYPPRKGCRSEIKYK